MGISLYLLIQVFASLDSCQIQLSGLKGLVLEIEEGKSRSKALSGRAKPERRLFYFWPKDQKGRLQHYALALSFQNEQLVKQESILSYYNEELGRYEISFDLVGALEPDERIQELSHCRSCHSVHPRTGRLEIFNQRTAFNIHPEARRWIFQLSVP